jgi:hypothetical protein
MSEAGEQAQGVAHVVEPSYELSKTTAAVLTLPAIIEPTEVLRSIS